jgi:hypothetical protein
MAAPTRAQITGTVTLPKYRVYINQGSGDTLVSGASVLALNTSVQTTNNIRNGFAFGSLSHTQSTIEITRDVSITNWRLARVKIQYGYADSDFVTAFEGIITERQRTGNRIIFQCSGFNYLIERTEIYTPVFYRRPLATKTTVSSVEDYRELGAEPGLLNIIMYECGGRPYEQPSAISDPKFKFWYSFDQSIITPRFSWISAENAWDEVFRIVRAAGGQFYQDKNGVFYYKQPLTYGHVPSGVTPYHFTESLYSDISEESSTAEKVTSVRSSFVMRNLEPMQVVYESSEPRLLPKNEETLIRAELQYPVMTYNSNINSVEILLDDQTIKAIYFDGRDATDAFSTLTCSVISKAAQLIELEFDNQTGEPIALNKIEIWGAPVMAGAEGLVKYGTDRTSELQLEDNPYIQSYSQAYRLVRMVYDFYSKNYDVRTISGVAYDPDRYLGEVVSLTYTPWGITNERHRIIGLEYQNGSVMSVTMVSIAGLPTRDDVYIVQTETYTSGTTKMVSY